MKRMIRVQEAANLCGLTRQTIYDYITDGKIRINKEAYAKFQIIRVNHDDVIRTANERAEMRKRRDAKKMKREMQ